MTVVREPTINTFRDSLMSTSVDGHNLQLTEQVAERTSSSAGVRQQER